MAYRKKLVPTLLISCLFPATNFSIARADEKRIYFNETFVSISCQADTDTVSYKGYGVDYAANIKINIHFDVAPLDARKKSPKEDTSLYTSATGSWSSSTYIDPAYGGGIWGATVAVIEDSSGYIIGSRTNSCTF